MIARHVRRRNDAFNLHQLGELLRRAFERDLGWAYRWFQVGDAEHLPCDAEQQVVLPLHIFRRVRQRKADLTRPINMRGHRENIASLPVAGNRDQSRIASSARVMASSSLGAKTVRKSSSTRPSSTRVMIGGAPRRSRAASSSALSESAVTASRKVGSVDVGADPPPTSDSPATISVFRCFAELTLSCTASARKRTSSGGMRSMRKKGTASWLCRIYSISVASSAA